MIIPTHYSDWLLLLLADEEEVGGCRNWSSFRLYLLLFFVQILQIKAEILCPLFMI